MTVPVQSPIFNAMDTIQLVKQSDLRSQAMTLENPRFSPLVYWRTRFLLIPLLLLATMLTGFLYYLWTPKPIYQSASFLPYSKLLTPTSPLQTSTLANQEKKPAKLLPLEQRQNQFWPMVRKAARQHKLDPALVMAVIQVESCFRPNAISPKGAMGLMQITGPTAKHLGLSKPMDPKANIKAGVRYLAELKRRFKNNVVMTLAAYNAGPTKVRSQGKVPDHRETRQYITRVLGKMNEFRTRFQGLAKN